MREQPVERWKQLCEEASKEHNSERLRELVAEIDALLRQTLERNRNAPLELTR